MSTSARDRILASRRWLRVLRQRIAAWVVRWAPELALPVGWGFGTWAAFLWNARAWAGSFAVYCFLYVGVRLAILRAEHTRNSRGDRNA